MASTYTQIYLHIVFSTKNRQPWITPNWRFELHKYLAGAVRGMGAKPIAIGGIEDHVHLLVDLTSSHCLKDFMRDLKTSSSKWAREKSGMPMFRWQEGYSAFSVSESAKVNVTGYIQRQEAHHHGMTYQEELLRMLKRAKIEFDPRYID